MRLPLSSAKGLTDYQIDFIKKHTQPTKHKSMREHVKTMFWWVLYGATAAGLWYHHLNPEVTPEGVVNFTSFGVWLVMVSSFVAAILLTLLLVGTVAATIGFEGVKEAAKKQNATDDNGEPIADQMSAVAHKMCKSLLPQLRWNPSLFFSSLIYDGILLAFFTGLVVTGWTFFAVCYFLIWSLRVVVDRLMRGLILSHVKSLTPERVAVLLDLEAQIDKNKDGGDSPRVIEAHVVDVNRNDDGVLEAEHTETFRFRTNRDT